MVVLPAHLRAPRPNDGAAVWRLAGASGTLDLNSPYAYLLACRDFADTSMVAEVDGALAGFVIGLRPPRRRESLFVWQVAVAAVQRGRGLAGAMLDHVIDRHPDVRWLEATVTPDNLASDRLFRSFAARRGTGVAEEAFAASEDFPPEAGRHEPETLYRIGPLAPAGADRPETATQEERV